MKMTDLWKLAEKVTDEKSFISFLRSLEQDRANEIEKEKRKPSSPYGPGANGWENGTIKTFLDAAVAWAEATVETQPSKLNQYKKPDNPWTRCAQILLMGKLYE